MNNIYIPTNSTFNKCYVIQNENTIRAYDTTPQHNTSYAYRDYYINSNYIYRDGEGSWSNYSTLPICLDNNLITDNFIYRNDFADSLIIFFIVFIFAIYFPYRIISRMFGRWLKV